MKRSFPYILALVLPFLGGPAFAQQIGGAGAGVQVSGTPTTGNCAKWVNSTAIGDSGGACGGGGGGSSVLYAQTSIQAGDTTTTSGAKFASSYTWSAGTFCPSVGTVYHVTDAGDYSITAASTIATAWQLDTQFIEPTTGIFVNGPTITNAGWYSQLTITCLTTGTTGTIEVQGWTMVRTDATATHADGVSMAPNTATFTVDTTAAHTIFPETGGSSFTGSMTQRQLVIVKE